MPRWTREELDRLAVLYPDVSVTMDDLEVEFGRHKTAIRVRANSAGLSRNNGQGMGRFSIDEMGNSYGALKVLSPAKAKSGKHAWSCRCECGVVVIREGGSLRRSKEIGTTPNCGCLQKAAPGRSAFNAFFSDSRRGAIRRGYVWDLSQESFRGITAGLCTYCGCSPSQHRYAHLNGGVYANGIDRRDNGLGYEESNCYTCCYRCNKAKNTLSHEEFLGMVKAIFEFVKQIGEESHSNVTPAATPPTPT